MTFSSILKHPLVGFLKIFERIPGDPSGREGVRSPPPSPTHPPTQSQIDGYRHQTVTVNIRFIKRFIATVSSLPLT